METFSTLLALCELIHRSPVNSPHKGQWRRVLMFSLICAWTNDWANHRHTGDLRRHRAHYDVTVMITKMLGDQQAQQWSSFECCNCPLNLCPHLECCAILVSLGPEHLPSCVLWSLTARPINSIIYSNGGWLNREAHSTKWEEGRLFHSLLAQP